MIILEDGKVDYIFLSRYVSLPLSVLKIFSQRDSFSEIKYLSKDEFESILRNMKKYSNVFLRNMRNKVQNFVNYNNENTFKEIRKNLEYWKENEIKCVGYFEERFPSLLKKIKQPPKLIFIKGEIKPQDEIAVAMIGSRNPTSYGREMAIKIAKRFVELGFTIISGFARGIDTISMKAALDNGGRAIGVIASGVLNLYPKENSYLVDKLVINGALISERFPEKSVNKRALQIRNRITSGLGLGNVFVEGNDNSGSLWQLKFGKEQGKIAIGVKPIGDYEQAYVPNVVIKKEKGEVITKIGDVDYISEVLLAEYDERKKKEADERKKKKPLKHTNLFDFYERQFRIDFP